MNKRSFAIFAAYFAAVAGLSSGIFDDDPVKAVLTPAQFSPTIEVDNSRFDENDPLVLRNTHEGMPRRDPKWDHGPTEYVVREGYMLEHSARFKIPIWVSELVTKEQITGDAVRRDKFKADPELSSLKAFKSDYVSTGFDRGHQSPAGNQAKDKRLKDETFYLSNMAPQAPYLNRNIWRILETDIRDWILEPGAGYERKAIVITGSMFYDEDEEHRDTADGLVGHFMIGRNNVAVPTHFYKIVLAPDSNDTWHSIAFVLENRTYPRPYNFDAHIVSVKWIETRTGIDFMPLLSGDEKRRLEEFPSSNWLN